MRSEQEQIEGLPMINGLIQHLRKEENEKQEQPRMPEALVRAAAPDLLDACKDMVDLLGKIARGEMLIKSDREMRLFFETIGRGALAIEKATTPPDGYGSGKGEEPPDVEGWIEEKSDA